MTTLHTKLKRRLIAQYMIDAGGIERMTQRDWHLLGQGIAWRLRMVDRLAATVSRGALDRQQFVGQVQAVAIRRQIEDDLTIYQEQLDELTEELRDGDITEEEYESRVEEMAIAILILAFLLGRGGDEDDLTDNELFIVLSAKAVLSGESRNAGAILISFDALDIDDDAKEQVNEAIELAIESAPNLGTYAPAATEQGIAARLAVWVTAALGLYTVGQVWNRNNPHYVWNLGATERHCADCLRLNGQVHTAEEWRGGPFLPQSGALACRGFRCDCRLNPADGPSRGGF